ncbi:MAG: L,D-transpeptidase [Hyphomicrobiaceae bacterium]
MACRLIRMVIGLMLLTVMWAPSGARAADGDEAGGLGQGGAIAYLESLRGGADYLAPSEIDPRFTLAYYVNASGSGPNRQRMWVLARERVGGPWRLAMWDEAFWKKKGLGEGEEPTFSWLVSTGRKYPGDKFSGPTPLGVFGLDERRGRVVPGYAGPGMIHAMFIDLHYTGGRRSGVAFHGTTPGRYGRLGSIDSHGCIRMHQRNAMALLRRMTGRDGVLSEELRSGEVPRFWLSERGGTRNGYRRNGQSIAVEKEAMRRQMAVMADDAVASDETRFPPVLTKSGYRAIAIIFAE